jgi:5-methylcytosine-specific restriction enzyme subunit McrC
MLHVGEYARITTQKVENSWDVACVPRQAFDWLVTHQSQFTKSGASVFVLEGQTKLRIDNYVGVIKTPCGTEIEVLPKTQYAVEGEQALIESRQLLINMIRTSMGLPVRESGPADVQLLKYPLSEWLQAQFLNELNVLVKRGIRHEYVQVEEESRYLRGRLLVQKQARKIPGRKHIFNVRHEVFSPDRPENRLLRLAVEIVLKLTRYSKNWRLANELLHYLMPVPKSHSPSDDLRSWQDGRLMQTYRAIRPWCELIVKDLNPTTQAGSDRGMSLMFPMERLFEGFVAAKIRRQLPRGWKLKTQSSAKYLCVHQKKNWMNLKPDMILEGPGGKAVVLDAKWKLLDSSLASTKEKYGLSQSDFYQLFAYGQHYLGGIGDMFLLYPKHPRFEEELSTFKMLENLNLRVVPFDLKSEEIESREWSEIFSNS